MSATQTMNELVAFEGAVECAPGSGAINLILRGRERGGGTAVDSAVRGLIRLQRTDRAAGKAT